MALKWKTDAVGTTGGKATVAQPMIAGPVPVIKFPKTVTVVSPVIEPVVIHTPQVQAETEIQALTKEYIELRQKYDYFEVKELTRRMEEIRKQLHAVANETMDGNQPAVFSCSIGEIEFSERQKAAEVPDPLVLIQELLVKFGPEATTSVVDIAITPLRKLLSEFELKKHLAEVPGSRTLRAVRPL